MEPNPDQNKNEGFFQKNRNYIIAAVIVIVAIILIVSQRKSDDNQDTRGDQDTEQTAGDNGETMDGDKDGDEDKADGESAMDSADAGNVAATGTLKISDNASKGNLMVDSNRGKIYIKTARDFTNLLDKQVTLQADGKLDSFTFLGFKEGATKVADQTDDKGGSDEAMESKPADDSAVTVSGKLMKSDKEALGNYVVDSSQGKVYLKTAKDYAAWVGSVVTLTAKGNIDSFSGASLSKK